MTGMMNRRELLASLAALGVVAVPAASTGQARSLNILWRNAWAIVNIGDIGHVPGALALLRHYIPEATVTLWAQQDLVFRDPIAQRARFPEGASTRQQSAARSSGAKVSTADRRGGPPADDPEHEARSPPPNHGGRSGAGVNAGPDLLPFLRGPRSRSALRRPPPTR